MQAKTQFDMASHHEAEASETIETYMSDELVARLIDLSDEDKTAYQRVCTGLGDWFAETNVFKTFQRETMAKFPQIRRIEFNQGRGSVTFWMKEPTASRRLWATFGIGGPQT
jgi:hypothetical protein